MNETDSYQIADQLVHHLERLTRVCLQETATGQVRRMVCEAMAAFSGEPSACWWKWIQEAGTSLGLRVKVLDLSLDQAMAIVRDGGHVATWLPRGEGSLLTLLCRKGKKLLALASRAESDFQPRSVKEVRQLLETGLEGKLPPQLRWVVVESQHISRVESSGAGAPMSPQARLLAILRPEWRDISALMVFAFLVSLLSMATPIAIETLVNTVAFGRLLQPIVVLSLLLLGFLSFAAILYALQSVIAEVLQQRLFVRIVADLSYRLPRLKKEALDHYHGPELVNRFFEVVTVQKVVASLLLGGLSLVLTSLTGMAILAFYHPWLLGFDVLLVIIMVSSLWLLGRGAVRTAVEESKRKYETAAWLQELGGCQLAMKLHGGAEFASSRANALVSQYLQARREHFRVLFWQFGFMLGLQAVAATVLLGFGGWLVISNQLTLGQLVAAELIVSMILSACVRFCKHLEGFYDLLAALDELGELFDLPVEPQDGLMHVGGPQPAGVALHRVAYHFHDAPGQLHELSLAIAPGEVVGIAGPPGSGKSTLLDLIYGLRRPSAGHLTLDQVDPRELRPDILRSHVALVRGIEVFEGSILDNILLDRPGAAIAEVRELLGNMGVLDDLLALPQGWQTHITRSGSPLTGEQMRLMVLARAIAGRPRLLMIDGLLDGLADATFQRVLPLLVSDRQRTVLIVSGRTHVLSACDRVVSLAHDHPTHGPSPGIAADVPPSISGDGPARITDLGRERG